MNILVVNDDGIDAPGIRRLAETLSSVADIYVCAPDQQRSACGHGITINKRVAVKEAAFPNAKLAFAMGGTPADCVKIGLEVFKSRGIEMDKVFSGINHGGNMGTDILYSGTVSAAVEGAVNGLPAVAVSVNARNIVHYETITELALRAAQADLKALGDKVILNINAPHLPKEKIKGVIVTGVGLLEYIEWYENGLDENGVEGYVYSGEPVHYEGLGAEESDVGAFQEGYASISPLHFDLTEYRLMEKVRASGLAAPLSR
jgi:5'-nucleotidase